MTVHTQIRAEDVRRTYAKWAGHYDFTFALFGRRYIRKIVNRLNTELHGHRVLDVGTGTGLSLPYFAADCEVTGIDLSGDMLARAFKRVERKKLSNVHALLEMDASELDFSDASFDSVMATFVMSVVPDPAKVLQEICRVTRPGGRVYLFNHFEAEEEQTLLAMIERKIAPASRKIGFHSDFSREQLKLKDCDLQVLEENSFGPLGMFTLLTMQKPAS